jgi:hypothetical protein
MKNLLILCAFVLFSANTFAVSIPKGSLIGIHNVSIKLKGSATQAQYLALFKSKWIPAASKAFDCEVHVLNLVRGKSDNKIGLLFIYKSAAARDKFYVSDGVLNDTGKAAAAKFASIDAELNKLGTTSGSYIDWSVQ